MKLLTYIVAIYFGTVYSQSTISPEHRLVLKEIKKVWEISSPGFSELVLADTSFKKYMHGSFYKVGSDIKNSNYIIYVGRVNTCRMGGCTVSINSANAESFEYFDYCILFDDNLQVASTRVFNYQATHGHEICSRGWLKQFEGYDGSKVINIGKDIDAISGATISVYSIATDVELVTKLLRKNSGFLSCQSY